MNRKKQLTAENREFFTLVRQAITTNPFSDERLKLDKRIADFPGQGAGSHNIDRTISAIEAKIRELEKPRKDIATIYTGVDRNLIETAILFWLFYRFRKNFDAFIQKQIEAGETPIKLDFFDEIFAFLKLRGFEDEEIQRTIEHSYQFRRAFHFINRNLIGRSPVMKTLRHNLWNNIFTHNLELYRLFLLNRMEDFSTLILGETGTGKGTVASAIGRSGYIPFEMSKKSFVESFMQSFRSINLSQFPETLIESELFGHKKGAFTGAIEDYMGIFGRCSFYGAIFLDEIGETSHPIQIKLLQVLQDRVFHPVGSRQQERFQGRVITATNRPLQELRYNKVFRDDFYYRMCSDIISVPSLRQRIREDPSELDDLLDFIVARLVGDDAGELIQLVKDTIRKQPGSGYPWYGNVRELEQCVRRVILKKEYEGDIPDLNESLEKQISSRMESGEITASQLMSGYCSMLYDRHGTYEEVSKITGLDRRTVTKHIKAWSGF